MSDRELIWWGNQYGNGIVIKGDLANKIEDACAVTGETPKEFLLRVIDERILDYEE
jgi:hypothetical protein